MHVEPKAIPHGGFPPFLFQMQLTYIKSIIPWADGLSLEDQMCLWKLMNRFIVPDDASTYDCAAKALKKRARKFSDAKQREAARRLEHCSETPVSWRGVDMAEPIIHKMPRPCGDDVSKNIWPASAVSP
jgi:hypothetical protein